MISLKVEDGKIYTQMRSDPKIRIDSEIMAGITELLAEFKMQLMKQGETVENVDNAIESMLKQISKSINPVIYTKMINEKINSKQQYYVLFKEDSNEMVDNKLYNQSEVNEYIKNNVSKVYKVTNEEIVFEVLMVNGNSEKYKFKRMSPH